jgi:hypothetical protein
MRLYIDDLRDPPSEEWRVARTSAEALGILEAHKVLHEDPLLIEEISFDHDLGGDDTTRRIMDWIEENHYWPLRVFIHTGNPVGRDYLLLVTRTSAPEYVQVGY